MRFFLSSDIFSVCFYKINIHPPGCSTLLSWISLTGLGTLGEGHQGGGGRGDGATEALAAVLKSSVLVTWPGPCRCVMFQLNPTFRGTSGVTFPHRDRPDLLLGRQEPAGIVFVALAMETRRHESIKSSDVEVCRTELCLERCTVFVLSVSKSSPEVSVCRTWSQGPPLSGSARPSPYWLNTSSQFVITKDILT